MHLDGVLSHGWGATSSCTWLVTVENIAVVRIHSDAMYGGRVGDHETSAANAEVARTEPTATESSTVAQLRGLLARGRPSPSVVAQLIQTNPAGRDAALALLHQTLGNSFVQEVVATLMSKPGTVQSKTDDRAPDSAEPVAAAKAGVDGAADAMPHESQIQTSFGRYDVSGIRTRTGGRAAQASQNLGASAYAIGDQVGFAQTPDLHTAAHEAAHVVQQRSGVQLKGGVDGGRGDVHEQHADAVADQVVRGESAEGLLDGMAGSTHGGGATAVQRAPAQQQAPGASITLTLFDKAKQFITSRTEPLYSEGASGSYVGEIVGGAVKWDGGALDVKVGSRVEPDGRLTGAMTVAAWAAQAGKGRAAYVLVDVDAAELRGKDQKDGAKPWLDGGETSTQSSTSTRGASEGTDRAATDTSTSAGTGGHGVDGPGGDDDQTRAGTEAKAGHEGSSTNPDGEKGGTRTAGHRSDTGHGDGSRHGKRDAQKRDVGYFWDPDRQHDGTQDTAPDGADKDGMVGGAGKHGDQGIPDVGAWTARIPVPKRFASAVTAAMILYQANIQQIAKDLIKAAEKTAEAELKAYALHEIEALTRSEFAHLAEKGVLEGMDEAALAAAREEVRNHIVQRLSAEVDAQIANAERSAALDRANARGDQAQYAADDLAEEQKAIAAARRARSAVDSAKSQEGLAPVEPKSEGTASESGAAESKSESVDANPKLVATEAESGAAVHRETMKAPSTGKDVEVATSGRAVVPTGKVEAYPRGKVTPFTEDMKAELRELKAQKQATRKAFDANPANTKRLDELEKLKHNYERSVSMARTLEGAGLEDTLAGNNEIIRQLLEVGQTVTEGNNVNVRTILVGRTGKVLAETTWAILPDGRSYLATIKLKPMTP